MEGLRAQGFDVGASEELQGQPLLRGVAAGVRGQGGGLQEKRAGPFGKLEEEAEGPGQEGQEQAPPLEILPEEATAPPVAQAGEGEEKEKRGPELQ